MSTALTLLCSERGYREVADAARSCDSNVRMEGSRENWNRLTLRFSSGTLVLTSLVRQAPGDRFSNLVLSMHNFFRTVETDAVHNREHVLGRVASVQMLIGVLANPDLSEMDERLNCLWRVAEALDAVLFNGNAMLNRSGERILSRSGEHDVWIT